LGPGQVAIDDRTAERLGAQVGDRIKVQLPRGAAREYQVVTTYEWVPFFSGPILPEQDAGDFLVPQPSVGFVQLRPDADRGAAQAAVADLLADSPEVSVTDMS